MRTLILGVLFSFTFFPAQTWAQFGPNNHAVCGVEKIEGGKIFEKCTVKFQVLAVKKPESVTVVVPPKKGIFSPIREIKDSDGKGLKFELTSDGGFKFLVAVSEDPAKKNRYISTVLIYLEPRDLEEAGNLKLDCYRLARMKQGLVSESVLRLEIEDPIKLKIQPSCKLSEGIKILRSLYF